MKKLTEKDCVSDCTWTFAQKYAKEMDEGLTNEQRNIQHAMVQMVDKHLHG